MRLFFAITLSEVSCDQVAQLQAHLRATVGDEGIRWTPRLQFHYTLKFLGDATEAELTAAIEAARIVAAESSPFTFSPAGIGVFPTPRHPQVLWLGIARHEGHAAGAQALENLAARLESGLVERGFAPEERAFRPHLTLARIKTRTGEAATANALPQWIAWEQTQQWLPIHIARFALLDSELHPTGAVYTLLETFPLSSVLDPD
jgi:2'-5' RNA ligase